MKLRFIFLWLLVFPGSLLTVCLQAQNQGLVFHRLTVDDGLSSGDVKQVFQDSQGFIWLATEDGLNFFDGYTFKTYKHIAADTNSISNNTVISIAEDKSGHLWIGTHNGLNVFDRSSQVFKKYFYNQKDPKSISNNHIANFCFDKNDRLWIGTDNGLNRYDPKTGSFTRYNVVEDANRNIKGNSVSALVCDKNGMIWTSEYFRGINKTDPSTGAIKNYPVTPGKAPVKAIATALCTNPNGHLWLGLINGEIADFNPAAETADYYYLEKEPTSETQGIGAILQAGDGQFYAFYPRKP